MLCINHLHFKREKTTLHSTCSIKHRASLQGSQYMDICMNDQKLESP